MPIQNKKWQVAKKPPQSFIDKFPEFDPVILQLLYNRGLDTQENIDEFFNPDYSQDFFDPFLLKDMDRAVDRIKQALDKKERVAIYGDYDADGVTSSVLLMELFRDILGLQGQVYIPDRATEGYGMNKKAIDWLADKKVDLIITCDCGVSNKEEIDYAKEKGIDVIITDHHSLPHEFDDDYIVINSKQEGDKYPYKDLAGVGIAFKLAQAVVQKQDDLGIKFKENIEKKFLDLVAIGTVADCSPIISENRTLVKYGLGVIGSTKRKGLRALMRTAGVDVKNISGHTIGFAIAPRINAAGRLDHANSAYKLLATNDEGEAQDLASQLQKSNVDRQGLTSDITEEAKQVIGKVTDKDKLLAAVGDDWPIGVVGIVAGRITEETHRPTLIAGREKDKCVGSARSVDGFNVIEAIRECKDILLEHGGHSKAAGFSVKKENIDEFFDRMKKAADSKLSEDDLEPVLPIDAEMELKNINWEFYENVKKLEPHGIGNEKPLFQISNVKVMEIFGMGNSNQHIKVKLMGDKGASFEAVGFNMGEYLDKIKNDDIIDIACEVDLNEWNGMKKLQLIIRDIKNKK